ncbi:MAG TPA: peptidylprolyl isomerase [Flavisolibacter sp.]|nr:peptidylprolyl isomerase [Flavisolibacter sp.]
MRNKLTKFLLGASLLLTLSAAAQQDVKLKRKDRKRDVELTTTQGTMVIRLYDATPVHRDNFLRLVKSRYYDSILFHRVIRNFMIQAGDPQSRRAAAGIPLGGGGPGYTLPAELRPELFHQKGALAAARMGDDVNPEKKSSGSQFYIVQGKAFTPAGLDSVETFRLKGYKLPAAHRQVYQTTGGTPHLDQQYTVFGQVISGLEVLDLIAALPVSRQQGDRPVSDARILKARLVKRKKK